MNIVERILPKLFEKIELYVALFILISGLLFLIIGLDKNIDTLKQVSIVLLACSILYLTFRNKLLKSKNSIIQFTDSKNLFLTMTIIFFFSVTISVLFIYFTIYSRPLYYVILLAIMAGVIASQIFLTNEKNNYYIILVEIIILGIIIRYSIFYQFSTVVGGDPWVHVNSINTIINSGHVTRDVTNYDAFPLMFIFVTLVYYLMHITVLNGMFILGASEMIVVLLLFVVISKIFDMKIGLLSALLLTVTTDFIQYGFIIIPQTIGIIYLGVLIFLVFYRPFLNSYYKKIVYTIFVFIFMIGLILSHTITSLAALIILLSIFLVDYFLDKVHYLSKFENEKFFITFTLVLLFGVSIICYWMYQADMWGYIGQSLQWGLSVAYQSPSVSTQQENFITSSMKLLPLYLIIFLSLIGLLYSLNNKYFKNINLYGWPLVAFVFASVVLGLNTFLPARWFVFLDMVLMVPMAIAIISIVSISPKKILTVFIIVSLSSLIFMTNYEANSENINPYTPYPTQAMSQSEATAISMVLNKTPSNTQIYLDLGYHDYKGDPRVTDASAILAGETNISGILLLRQQVIDYGYFTSALGGGQFSVANFNSSLLSEYSHNSEIYNSGSVYGFIGNNG
jgi:hypothetical protein